MRLLLRAGALALVLIFGIPAVSLLLGHFGVIRLPRDPYLRSVTEVAPASAIQDYIGMFGGYEDDRAQVAIGWSISGRRPNHERSGMRRAPTAVDAGKLTVTLERVDGDWRAVRIEPKQ